MQKVVKRAFSVLAFSSSINASGTVNKVIMETRSPRWEAMWAAGIAPGQAFDAGVSSPALLKLLKEDQIPKGRALVPGCGRGYDVVALASANRNALGIEIAELAVDAARDRLNALPASEQPPEGSAKFQLASFFDLPTEKIEDKFDFVYDYTFLCALDPSIRDLWATKMSELVKPGGELLTLIFPISEEKEGGPPFRVSLDVVKDLLQPMGFESFQLELLPSELCHPGRDGIKGPYASGIGRWRRKE